MAREHDWKAEISRATGGAAREARESMRSIQGIADNLRFSVQQVHNGYVGLEVNLPRAYNAYDAQQALLACAEMGIATRT